MAIQQQVALLEERLSSSVNSAMQGLQRQGEADRRRLTQLERKLDARLEERAREDEGREKWAELRGSVNGLIEELQAVTKRVEGLDERLWARTGGAEMAKQRNREMEQQVQALEQQVRLNSAAMDEASKRQATKMRRTEHAMEEAMRRLAKVEEEARTRQQQGPQWDEYSEVRVSNLEQQQERVDCDLNKLQMQIDELMQGPAGIRGDEESGGESAPSVEDAMLATEKGLAALRKEIMGQVEDLSSTVAGLKVKSDGQSQRVTALADRLEKAHEPAMEAFRAELGQLRQQDRRDIDAELGSLRSRVQEGTESSEEAVAEVRQALRQTAAEIAALSLRPEENSVFRNFDERLSAQEQESIDLRGRVESLPPLPASGVEVSAIPQGEESKLPDEDELEDIRRRLEWLEEQSSAGAAAERSDQRKAQDTICELVESVSRLKQQAATAESSGSALQQQLQQVQTAVERRLSDDLGPSRMPAESEARVREMWDKVAELHARLLEVEGGLDFARESSQAPLCEASAISAVSEAASTANAERRVLPPLPRGGEPERERGEGGAAPATPPVPDRGASNDVREKLEAVAEHLEVVDELMDRVAVLERRAAAGEIGSSETPAMAVASPAKASEVSFGGDAPIKALSPMPAGVQSRLVASEQEIAQLREDVAKVAAEAKDLSLQLAAVRGGGQSGEGDQSEMAPRLQEAEKELLAMREGLSKQELSTEKELAALKESLSKQETLAEQLHADSKEHHSAREAFAEQLSGLRQQLQQASISKLNLGSVAKAEADATDVASMPRATPRDDAASIPRMSPREMSSVASRDGPDLEEIVRAQLEALSEQMSGKLGELNVVKGTVDDLEEAMKESKGQIEETRKAAELASSELRGELQQIKEELKEDLAAASGRALELDKTRLEVVKLTTDLRESKEVLASMKEHDATLADLRRQVESLGSCKGDAGGSGLPDGLLDRLKSVEEKVAAAPSGAVPEGLEERLKKLEEQPAGKKETEEEARLEVQRDVQQLRSKLESELGSLAEHQKGLAETRTALDKLSEHVHGLPAPAVPQDVEALAQRVKALEEGGDCGASGEELSGLKAQLKALEDGVASVKEQPQQPQQPDELREQLAELKGKIAQLLENDQMAELKQQVLRLEGQLRDAEGGLASLKEKPLAERKAVEDLQEKLEKLSAAGPSHADGAAAASPEVAEKLRKFEERLASAERAAERSAAAAGGAGAAAGAAGGGDDEARMEVQQQVAALKEQVSKELACLAQQQQGLASARLDLEGLAEARSKSEDLSSLREQLEAACKRSKAAEDTASAVKRELDQLQGTRKVGISLGGDGGGSPEAAMSDMRQRLSALSEQVAELQQAKAAGGRQGRTAASAAATPEASLNFSLTEQSERVGGESLNFSLTQSMKELSLSEPLGGAAAVTPARRRPGLNTASADAAEAAGSAGGSPASISSDSPAAGLASPKGEGKESDNARGERRSSPGGGQKGGDALDSVLAGASSSSSKSSRPRPSPLRMEAEERGLATVAEEESSEAGEGSQEEPSSKQQQGPPSKTPPRTRASPLAGAVGCVPEMSPSPGAGSVGSLDDSRSNLGISASCNEVSVGVDYSVEDSTELDKCDHIETVSPNILDSKVRGGSPAGLSRSGGSAASSPAGISRSPAGAALKDQRSPPSTGASPAGLRAGGGAGRSPAGTSASASPAGAGTSPAGSAGRIAGGATGGGDTLDALVAKPAPAAADTLDALLAKPGAVSGSGARPQSSASPPGKASPKHEDEYGEESFEENGSIAESIDESVEGSGGSNAWGEDEDV